MNQVINIEKEAGVNRARSADKINAALTEHLKRIGMTFAEFKALKEAASRPFEINEDGFIIIPARKILACIVQSTGTIRSAGRPCQPDQIHRRIKATDFVTTKYEPDEKFERFVTVSSGTGMKLSNQRGFRSNEVITDFDAVGFLSIDPSHVSSERLKELLIYAGANIGIGASRKMGYGGFTVSWESV